MHEARALDCRVSPAPACGRIVLRGDESVRLGASSVLGLLLPAELMRSTSNDASAALKLGPDEWLLLVGEAASGGFVSACRRDIEAPHAAVDVSECQCGLDVRGAGAEDLLASGCALDLSIDAFSVGMATRTLFGKCEIVLWRRAEQHFHLEVWRSYLEYLTRRFDLERQLSRGVWRRLRRPPRTMPCHARVEGLGWRLKWGRKGHSALPRRSSSGHLDRR